MKRRERDSMKENRLLLAKMTNLGVRAPDMDAEIAFLESFGGEDVRRSERTTDGVVHKRAHLHIGAVRFTLFPFATYDERLAALGEQRGGGIGHVAFEVPDTQAVLDLVGARGIEPLIPPFTVAMSSSGDSRRITYFRSPNGTVVETQESVAKR
jgi:catechol 2,3-dioxygenase-like lactoylglutathione lyase family enzyme